MSINAKEVLEVLDTLVGAIYDLYPDEEYEELYGIKAKIERANELAQKLRGSL